MYCLKVTLIPFKTSVIRQLSPMLLIGLFATYRFYEQVGRSIVKREYSLIRKRMWRFKKLRMFPLEASINIFSDDYNLLQLILHLYFLCYCLLVCLQINASFTAVFTGHVTYFKTHTLVFFRFTGIKKITHMWCPLF